MAGVQSAALVFRCRPTRFDLKAGIMAKMPTHFEPKPSRMSAKPTRKKYGAEPKRQPKPPVPGWIWLLTGCLLGAFVMFLLLVSNSPAPHQPDKPGW